MLNLRYEIARLNPRHRGLGIMTIGFLVACLGAGIAFGIDALFGQAAPGLAWLRATTLLVSWFVMIFGTLVMAAGIVMHWVRMWKQGEE